MSAQPKIEGNAGELPIHFFTIVLNGEPFIRYHLDIMRSLPFRWHWHIIEGVASLVRDTAWSVKSGGRIDPSLHDNGRSNDGTSVYLDQIAREDPEKISVYRKPPGVFWDGKLEMVQAPVPHIREACLLWQIDADELWTADQIVAVRNAFLGDPTRTAAYFWCHFFVGPKAIISTRYNYAQNPEQEWLRVWRFAPGDKWAAHEPPTLTRSRGIFPRRDIAKIAPFSHDETEALGAVFQHAAYVMDTQVRFKEIYYGYEGAVAHWSRLQSDLPEATGPLLLRDYLSWVTDDTMVDSVDTAGVAPIARTDGAAWTFSADAPAQAQVRSELTPLIVVDGVFFQHSAVSGIARVWKALLKEWVRSGFSKHVLLLDRAGTAPRIPGIRTRSIGAWDPARTGEDSLALQNICDEAGADLFISTYYSAPITTRSVFLAHDMIPELLGANRDLQIWSEKRLSARHAAAYISVSTATKRDFAKFFPEVSEADITAIPNAVDSIFRPAAEDEVTAFRNKHNLTRPYFLLVGERVGVDGYKNGATVFEAFEKWSRHADYDLVCVGGVPALERPLKRAAPNVSVRLIAGLNDDQLRAAYGGAQALIYASKYEGFGLPLLEAMACRCPVVASKADAVVEVGGDAPLYFETESEADLRRALDLATDVAARAAAIERGQARAGAFSWRASAERYADVLLKAAQDAPAPPALWRELREEQARQQERAEAMSARLENGLQRRAARHLRRELFQVRTVLARRLPSWAMPLARRVWRWLMRPELALSRSQP